MNNSSEQKKSTLKFRIIGTCSTTGKIKEEIVLPTRKLANRYLSIKRKGNKGLWWVKAYSDVYEI